MRLAYRRRTLSLALLLLPATVTARAILGVDLGSLYMKVALVQSGSPLEIVTNLHSKRKTEQMILFDQQQRFYGADASSLLARKSHQTPEAMSVLLGRDEMHPVVQVLAERHYPIQPTYNETRAGIVLTVDGVEFTPEELVAMVLTHAVDISVAYAAEHGTQIAPPKDCVLTVPVYATQHERRALMDAAALADLNVLTLIEETTAAALHYAMDKKFEEEELMIFYNMGGSGLQASLIRFFSYNQTQKFGAPKPTPALEVLSKAWDATLGGLAFDHVIVEYLADQFNHAWEKTGRGKGQDVRSFPRAMTKLRIQANKVKHVLSANPEIPVYMETVHDDVGLSTLITRTQFEEMSAGLLERVVKPIAEVLKGANKTFKDLTGIELIGGGMRIPVVQAEISKTVGDLELGLHINADESMALGAAFAGANISTAFRVRQVGMTDLNPFPLEVTLSDLIPDTKPKEEDEEWVKKAVIFKAFAKTGVKKTIAFTHDRDVHCALDYAEDDLLPPGTNKMIERYNITGVSEFALDMAKKELGKPKISLQFELAASGVTSLVRAEATVDETYTVQEEVEVDDDDEQSNATAEDEKDETKEDNKDESKVDPTENTTNATAVNSTKTKKKKKKILVDKEKKRVHRQPLTITAYHEGKVKPHSRDLLLASKQKLFDMASKDKERMMLDKSKNKVESYIYRIKNKLEDDEKVLSEVSTQKQRDEVLKLAEKAEQWLYEDGYSAGYATMEDKYAELSTPFEKILLRASEMKDRPAAVEGLRKKLTEVEQLMAKWENDRPQVTEEDRVTVLEKIEKARSWLSDKEKAQNKKKPHEDPVFLSAEVPMQLLPIEATVLRLSKKPKPKPPKNTTKASNETAEANVTDAANGTDTDAAANGTEAAAVNTTVDTDAVNETTPENTTEQSTENSTAEVEDEL